MSNNDFNAQCTICGKPYRVCSTCSEVKSFTPWRTVTDTIECYLIYSAIHGYTISGNKEKARQELSSCNLTNLNDFKKEIKDVIKNIMHDDVVKIQPIIRQKNNKKEKAEEVVADDNE